MNSRNALAAAAALALASAGCATMWGKLGVATEASVASREAEAAKRMDGLQASIDGMASTLTEVASLRKELDQLSPLSREVQEQKARIDELAAEVEATNTAVAELGQVRDILAKLGGRVDALPADTIRKLAEILAKAAEELSAPPK